MAFKFIALAALLACVRAGGVVPVAYSAPLAVAPVARLADSEYDPNPQYSFGYDVQDSLTGDSKSQSETRNGDLVQGQYSFIEADGTRRIVDYTADDVNGFNAVVRKEGIAVAAAPVVAASPVIAARVAAPVVANVAPFAASPVIAARVAAPVVANVAPVAARVAAPLAYTAPVARFAAPAAYSAPFAYAAAPVAKYASPVSYSAPFAAAPFGFAPQLRAAPLATSPLAYNAPLVNALNPLAYSSPLAYNPYDTPFARSLSAPVSAYSAPAALGYSSPLAYAAPVARYY